MNIFSDAAREVGSVCGFGAVVMQDPAFYIGGEWTEEEVEWLSIDVLEALAEWWALVVIMGRCEGRWVWSWVDNEAAKFVTNRCKPKSPLLAEVVRRMGKGAGDMGVWVHAGRVTSEENKVADWLSRGEESAAVGRLAGFGFQAVKLRVPAELRGTA